MAGKGEKIKLAGLKQTLKALKTGTAKSVYIAGDADPKLTQPVVALCGASGVKINHVSDMGELGRICGIDVGCAVAVDIE